MIEFLFDTPEVVQQLLRFGFNNIAISPVTVAEIQAGERDKLALNNTMKKLSAIPVIPIDAVISLRFSELFHRYCLSHRPSIPDVLIAATALSYNIELFTLNLSDYKFIRGLRLVQHRIKPVRQKR
ncbi:MAG: type II toxin-antitoxin system VapC family toxin [Chitinophagales bacterium]|nr:type II toxin-antitoxin system VapC family toxin [Chitinophagales bacterium]